MVPMDIGKKIFSLIIGIVAMSQKCFNENLNLLNLNYHRKIGLIGPVHGEIKCYSRLTKML